MLPFSASLPITALFLAFALILCFAGCGDKAADTGESVAPAGPGRGEAAGPGAGVTVGNDTPQDGGNALKDGADALNDGAGGGILRRQDEDGLIAIDIFPDGHGVLSFDFDRWESLHNISESPYYTEDWRKEGPFAIVTEKGGRIRDACIGKIDSFGDESHDDFVTPTVVLLMADGTLESLMPANPHVGAYRTNDDFFSEGKLPWLRDIVSLSYEQESGGIGEKAIFAKDVEGLIYDLRHVLLLCDIFDAPWEANDGHDAYPEEYSSSWLCLYEEGNRVSLETVWRSRYEARNGGLYEGTYTVHLADNAPDGVRPGLISFSLSMTDFDRGRKDERIVGTYFFSAVDRAGLGLWYSDGDYLAYALDGAPLACQYFYRASETEDRSTLYDDIPAIVTHWDYADNAEYYDDPGYGLFGTEDFSNEGLIDYLLVRAPEARDRVQKQGMAALCAGETSVLDGAGICRDIWLGADLATEFVPEVFYAISGSGDIYEYDPADDTYHRVFNNSGEPAG